MGHHTDHSVSFRFPTEKLAEAFAGYVTRFAERTDNGSETDSQSKDVASLITAYEADDEIAYACTSPADSTMAMGARTRMDGLWTVQPETIEYKGSDNEVVHMHTWGYGFVHPVILWTAAQLYQCEEWYGHTSGCQGQEDLNWHHRWSRKNGSQEWQTPDWF